MIPWTYSDKFLFEDLGTFAARNWRAEAYHVILATPAFHDYREAESLQLSQKLGSILKLFNYSVSFETFCNHIQEKCVKPALKLQEKTLTCQHDIRISSNPFILKDERGRYVTSSEFYHCLNDLECRDLFRNRKKFNPEKIRLPDSMKELRARLECVCTVVPSLSMTRVGQVGTDSATITIRKQQMLVGWDMEGSKEKFCRTQTKNVLLSIAEHHAHLVNDAGRPKGWRIGRFMPSVR